MSAGILGGKELYNQKAPPNQILLHFFPESLIENIATFEIPITQDIKAIENRGTYTHTYTFIVHIYTYINIYIYVHIYMYYVHIYMYIVHIRCVSYMFFKRPQTITFTFSI